MKAAEASLREVWPELTAKEASAEVVVAIAYASSHHPGWRGRLALIAALLADSCLTTRTTER
jgi:hypothetical protein